MMVPSTHLVFRERYLRQHVPLYKAALIGDWKAAESIINSDQTLVRAHITQKNDTALHIAVATRHSLFVTNLVAMMTAQDLENKNIVGSTALSFAALTGNVNIAEVMVTKNKNLPLVHGGRVKKPLYLAAWFGHGDMANYLFPLSDFESWDASERVELVTTCVGSGLYGLALKMVEHNPTLAVAEDKSGYTPLDVLARNPSAFGDGERGLWKRIINSTTSTKVRHEKLMQTKAFQLLKCLWGHVIRQDDLEISDITGKKFKLLFVAAELGNYEFLVELLRSYPDFLFKMNENSQTIFHIAVLYRHEDIFNLIYEIGALKEVIGSYRDGPTGENMLHLAAKRAPSNQLNVVSGAALQMQRQLLWYKEVERIVHPSDREMKNKDGNTPHELFTMEHKELMEEGLKWMKTTAKSCMLIATLIATVVFITAFTVPGGDNNTTGTPTFLNERFFSLFCVSEAIAMVSSSTSILMFLAILTSRFAENDFLDPLPVWLMIGMTTLLVSSAAMVVVFCTSFLLYYDHRLALLFILFTIFSCVPIMFALFNYHLVYDIIRSAYGSRVVFRSNNRLF